MWWTSLHNSISKENSIFTIRKYDRSDIFTIDAFQTLLSRLTSDMFQKSLMIDACMHQRVILDEFSRT
jgi:hypothetical protein